MRAWLLSCSLLGLAAHCAAQSLPAQFDHNRIRLVVHADDGSPLAFYTDSGGGFDAISRPVVDRLKLAPAGKTEGDDESFPLVEFPAFVAKSGVPAPLPDDGLHGKLAVTPEATMGTDGFLGSPWFAGRAWRIDYVRHEMALVHDVKPGPRDRALPMGFQTNAAGTRVANMPRVTLQVDGQSLDVLLDTGATLSLTDDSAPVFKLAPGTQVGGSFVTKTIFDGWHAKHPDWRVIERGDGLRGKAFPMIEVPRVSVAGFTVGTVWFAQRPDKNFTEMMSSMMDGTVVGALGGSGLQYFHVVLDYPKATAWFGMDATDD